MELKLLTFSKQFAKIHIHKNNDCAETILPSFMQDKCIPKKTKPLFSFMQNKFISEEIPIIIKRDN